MHEARTAATPAPSPDARPTGVRWRILALVCVASFVAYLLRTNMSVAGEPMMRELGLTQIQLGIVLAAFAWGYAAFQFPGGAWAERVGSRRAIAIIATLWGAFNLLTAFVPVRGAATVASSLVALVALRALMGAAQAPFFPATGGALTCNWFPVTGWAFPSSLGNAGLTLGAAATGPLIAWLMLRFGWRQSFALTAPLAFLLAAVWWRYVRNSPAQHRAVNAAEIGLIDRGRPEALCEPPRPGTARRMLRDPQVLLLTASYFCSNYVFYFFFNWLFLYLVDYRGMKVLESGVYASAPWISGAVGALLGGALCDRLSVRIGKRSAHRRVALTAVAVSGALLLAASAAAGPLLTVALLSLCLGFQQASDAVYWSAAISVSGNHSSSACGVMNTAGNVVGGVGALLVPLIVRLLGWPAALATGAAFAAVGALLWIWIRADREYPENAPA
ncbi:MAG TPA: MFS transporter [Thermoanaerobaculia bacterium]|jgi:ACS family glucarate transporter-like MFS transporter